MSASSLPKSSTREDRARVRAYFASLAPESRRALQKLRAAIRAAAPAAVETLSYGIPAFRLGGPILVWYAGWARHVSLYPMGTGFLRAHAAEVEGYETAKGTIRFPLSESVPTALVRRLVKARVADLKKKGSGSRIRRI
jgi:uncharacterized protein YdhG (YjbR/CyaY superfamily)